MAGVGIALGVLIVSLVVWEVVAHRFTSHRLDERSAYWTSVVRSGVAVGDTRDQAERWLLKTFARPIDDPKSYDPNPRSLSAGAETVEVVGSHYPCAAWEIEVDIQLGPDNRVASRGVRLVGACV